MKAAGPWSVIRTCRFEFELSTPTFSVKVCKPTPNATLLNGW